MNKFKVGDMVVVKPVEELWKYISYYVPSMNNLSGEFLTIKEIRSTGNVYVVEENDWFWHENMLESPIEKILPSRKMDISLKKLDKYAKKTYEYLLEGVYMNRTEIKTVRNYNDRAMVMQFSKKDYNGKPFTTKCVVQDGDTFDLDEGIKTCLLKYLLGGHKNYIKIMDAARKAYKNTMEADKKAAEEKENKKVKTISEKLAKKAANKARKEKDMEFLANAIKKALVEYDKERANAEEENK